MKNFQLILISVLISIYLTQEADTCSSSFKEELKTKCEKFTEQHCLSDNLGCFRRGCEFADDEATCKKTLPGGNADLHKRICKWSMGEQKCKEEDKICTDYNLFGDDDPESDGGDDCSQLKPLNEHQICTLKSKDTCRSLHKDCSDIDYNDCNDDVVVAADFSIICKKNTVTNKCERDSTRQRECTWINGKYSDGFRPSSDFNVCPKFKSTGTDKRCIHFKNKCIEAKIRCQDYNEDTCKIFVPGAGITNPNIHNHYNMPLNSDANEFDYSRKCIWKNNQCIDSEINCSDYDKDEIMCKNLKFQGKNIPKCFHKLDDSNHEKCTEITEKYDDCSSYNEKETDKDRKKCKNSLLLSLNKKCEYNLYRDECKAEGTYSKCSDYNNIEGEKDRIICESIKTENHPFYCILDKDNQCIERELNCEEVYDEKECLHIAKASDPNKICAYNLNTQKCYEEYIRCEDFIGTSNDPDILRDQCEDIKLYNGLKCKYDSQSNKCRSILKVCYQANSEEECKLIAKTGVSNPDRKVCDYIDSNCKEIFKYCSDYRGTDDDYCRNIKPYLSGGEKIDEYSRCEFEAGKCQKVPKYCSDADDNPILCNKISPFIKYNSTKYCRYDKHNNKCLIDYKTCNDYKKTIYAEVSFLCDPTNDYYYDYQEYNNAKEDCEKIIPKDYEIGLCEYKVDTSDNIYKCVLKEECSILNEGDDKYRELCNKLLPNCDYDSDSNTCKMIEKSCTETRFYSESEGSEDFCNKIGTSEPYKICTLKEDKSGCEEKYRELSFSTAASSYKEPPQTGSQESSEMIRGIQLIMILLCLLF